LQDFYAIYIYYGKHTLTNSSGRDCIKSKKKETIRNIGLNMGQSEPAGTYRAPAKRRTVEI